MLENPNPIDALNCLVTAEKELKRHNYLGAAQAATEAAQRLIACRQRQEENTREVLSSAMGCPLRHD
jgi:hypothetical protein